MQAPFSRYGPFVSGTIVILTAIFLFSVMGAIIKYLGPSYGAQQLSAFRNGFGLIPSCLVLLFSRDWHAAGRPIIIRQWKLGLLRGGFVAVAQVCFYAALVHIEFATASTLAFAGPLFITALSVPVLREHVGGWRWTAVAIGFVGILFIMRPGSEIFTLYAVLPILAAFFYACSSITVRLMDDDVPSATLNIYSTSGALLGALLILFSTSRYTPVASAQDWLWLIALGIVGGCAVLGLIVAYRLTSPSNLAPFEYFGIPFSFVIGWFAFGEAPFERLFPGALLIVAGGLLILWRERTLAPPDKAGP
ncbi:MAG: DMT family transporter [Pseudomonadota bacterium]